ncbi:methylated-DNA-[protein]-cysteine S-methyltransferase [Filimonas lacunae]|uniref:methylated-DNA--[protein]-cysteine S-methyltransferase n=1 Tax=Filimonas lacunae TaxID=477680 RepID=A0A173MKF8_9BACT|nr:methylated-DNA--[protein]-cysteine S-methyltransferase [Filimonas lacunae]BAV08123.1 methylated-DNA--protein-cysteine methyltransferase [Filimonas lacunae]SIT09654.1 methylated-DNA-[protein]-cysteine S-methyltransferase [Filimonas lacunae]
MYYTYYQSPVGLLKIGGTEQYISVVHFVDNEDDIVHDEPGIPDLLHECTEELIEFFNGTRRQFTIPVHQEGTEFQQRVWAQLLAIPYGRTISYMEQSIRLGDPKALRAVSTTNGKNQLAIIVPCHRVIGQNKSLVGYGGGLWRKKWLLDHEFKIAHGVQTLF